MTQPAETPDAAAAPSAQPQLYDAKGQPLALTGDDAAAAIAAGQAGFLKGQRAHVVTANGEVGTIDADKAPDAFQRGMRLATDEEIHGAKIQAKYGGLGGQAMTALLGASSGASLGATDLIGSALGGRQYIEEHREANPTTALVSELGGALVPTLATGGEAGAVEAANLAREGSALARAGEAANLATKVVGAPTRAVAKLGSGIEHVVHGLLGAQESTSVIGGLARKILAKGAGAAAEGALIGAAQEVDESVLGDHELNGEKVLAAMGHGALLGLGTGATLTAAGEMGARLFGKAAPALRGIAEEQAVRSATGVSNRGVVKEIERLPGGVRAAGRRMLDDGIISPGAEAGGEEIAGKIAQKKQEAGQLVTDTLDAADKAGFEGPSIKTVRDRIQSEVLDDLEKTPNMSRAAINRVRQSLRDMEISAGIASEGDAAANGIDRATQIDNARMTFRGMQDFRGNVGSAVNWKPLGLSAPENAANEAMKKVYGVLEDEVEQSGDRAAKSMGASFLEQYQQAKLAYRQYKVLDRLATDSVAAKATNRIVSPSDYLTGAAGAAAHHGGRMLVGGTMGAAAGEAEGGGGLEGTLGGFATGALAALAHHAIRTHGNSAAASLIDKLASLHQVEQAVQRVDRQVDRGIGGFFGETGRARVKLREPIEGEGGEHAADTSIRKVLGAVAANDNHARDIERASAPIAEHAPATSGAMQRAALRATMYLAGAVPTSVTGRPSITPQFDRPMLTDAQKNDYMRQVHAVHDPMTVLADMEAGTVTRSQVDALRIVYPSLYQDIVTRVQGRLADLRQPLTYAQKVSLSTLLGVPADETLSPAFVLQMQRSYPGGAGGGGGGAAPPKAPKATRRPIKGELASETGLGPRPGSG